MAKDKSKKAGKAAANTDENPLERLLAADPLANHKAFADWVVANGGPKISPKHVQIVVIGYKKFQRSPQAVEAREAAKSAREEAKAERAAAREARQKAAAEKKAEAKAKPAKKAAAKKAAPAAKKTAAKPAGKGKGKSKGGAKAAF